MARHPVLLAFHDEKVEDAQIISMITPSEYSKRIPDPLSPEDVVMLLQAGLDGGAIDLWECLVDAGLPPLLEISDSLVGTLPS